MAKQKYEVLSDAENDAMAAKTAQATIDKIPRVLEVVEETKAKSKKK